MPDILFSIHVPPEVPEEELARVRATVHALLSQVPPPGLTSSQMAALGYTRFGEAPLFVRLVAVALTDNPALFSDIPICPMQILKDDDAAGSWLFVRDILLALAARAHGHYCFLNGRAVEAALKVVRQVRADQKRPFPHPQADLREAVLLPAELSMPRGRPKKKQAGKAKRQKQETPPVTRKRPKKSVRKSPKKGR
jgi:hypothetical protein